MYRTASIFSLHGAMADYPHDISIFAQPQSHGGADAKRPGETISRPLRIFSHASSPAICWTDFGILEAAMAPEEFRRFLLVCLGDAQMRMERITLEMRAKQDLSAMAKQARTLSGICGNLGAAMAAQAARKLETACREHDQLALANPDLESLVRELVRSFGEAASTLRDWMEQSSPRAYLAVYR